MVSGPSKGPVQKRSMPPAARRVDRAVGAVVISPALQRGESGFHT
jgi:hypothetical protein